jgi:hypothetical protein
VALGGPNPLCPLAGSDVRILSFQLGIDHGKLFFDLVHARLYPVILDRPRIKPLGLPPQPIEFFAQRAPLRLPPLVSSI